MISFARTTVPVIVVWLAGCLTFQSTPDEDLKFVQGMMASYNYRESPNVAESPGTRSFFLIHMDDAGACAQGSDAGCIPPLSAFDRYAGFNRSRFVPEWRVVLEPSGALLATGNDTQISFPFSDPGYYRATVAVHDEVSGRIVLEKSAGVAAYWAREGEARISPGVSERHRLVDVPLSGDNLHALFRLHVEGDPPTMDPINQGRFLLVDALGGEHETHSTWPSDVQATNWPGPYRLEWESGRPIDTPVNVSAWAVFWRALDSGPSPVCTSLPC